MPRFIALWKTKTQTRLPLTRHRRRRVRTLKFKQPIRFQVNSVVQFPKIWHLVGKFLTGKFRMERRLRAEPDPRWLGVKVVELPGNELREVQSACGRMGRRSFYRPVYTGRIYILPPAPPRYSFLDDEGPATFKFDEVKILGALKRPRPSEPQGASDHQSTVMSPELKAVIADFQAFKKACGL